MDPLALPTLQTNTRVLLYLQINSTCHPTGYAFIPEAGQIFSLGWLEGGMRMGGLRKLQDTELVSVLLLGVN